MRGVLTKLLFWGGTITIKSIHKNNGGIFMDDLLKSFPRYVTLPEWELRILMGTETHVKPKDVYSLLRHMKAWDASYDAIIDVRRRYDYLIDDREKQLRKMLGIEDDYSHIVTAYNSKQYVDGLPVPCWQMLHDESFEPTVRQVNTALQFLHDNRKYGEEAIIRGRYSQLLCESEQAKLTFSEQRLLVDDKYEPQLSSLKSTINRLRSKGMVSEAEQIEEKYQYLLNPEVPALNTPDEEVDAFFRNLFEQK